MHYLKQIGYLLQDNAEAICESVKKDLGRNRDEVSFTEVWTSVREVDLTVKRLKGWMQDETAFWDTILAFKGNSQSCTCVWSWRSDWQEMLRLDFALWLS